MARIEEPCCRPLRQSGTTEKKNKKTNNLKYSYDQLHCNEKNTHPLHDLPKVKWFAFDFFN